MSYTKHDGASLRVGKNLKLFLGFLSKNGYSVTALDDFGLMYRVEKDSFSKFLCSTDFNSSECSRLLKDKLLTYIALEQIGISVPQGTYFWVDNSRGAASVGDILSCFATAKYPLIIKPNDSSLGRGVTVLEEYDEVSASKAILKAKRHSNVLLAQEYLQGQEFRIVAIRGEILIAVKKFGKPMLPEEVSSIDCPEILDIVNKSMRAFGALVCGYDIMAGENYVKVLEINSNPFIVPFEQCLSDKTIEGYFFRLEQLLRRNDQP